MCGIYGIYNIDDRPVDKNLLKKMNNILIHRVPDEEGYFVNENIAGSKEQGGWNKKHGVPFRGLKNGLGGKGNVGKIRENKGRP